MTHINMANASKEQREADGTTEVVTAAENNGNGLRIFLFGGGVKNNAAVYIEVDDVRILDLKSESTSTGVSATSHTSVGVLDFPAGVSLKITSASSGGGVNADVFVWYEIL